MHAKVKSVSEAERYNPDYKVGLTSTQVNKRLEEGYVNRTKTVVGKTTWEILRSNVFTFAIL